MTTKQSIEETLKENFTINRADFEQATNALIDIVNDEVVRELYDIKKLMDYSNSMGHTNTHICYEVYKEVDERINQLNSKKG